MEIAIGTEHKPSSFRNFVLDLGNGHAIYSFAFHTAAILVEEMVRFHRLPY
jgi:hypothetical protein